MPYYFASELLTEQISAFPILSILLGILSLILGYHVFRNKATSEQRAQQDSRIDECIDLALEKFSSKIMEKLDSIYVRTEIYKFHHDALKQEVKRVKDQSALMLGVMIQKSNDPVAQKILEMMKDSD